MPHGSPVTCSIIRHARATDIPAVRAMQEKSMWVLGANHYTAEQVGTFLTMFGTMDDALIGEGHFFVAEDSHGTILGSGGWTRSRPGYARGLAETDTAIDMPTVRSVFVDPAATRRGMASAIMNKIERDALSHKVDTLYLTATLSGVALYQALWYRIEEANELRFPDHTRFECIRMQKSLRDGAVLQRRRDPAVA